KSLESGTCASRNDGRRVMNTCPICGTNLTQLDFDLGRCSACRHLLVPGGEVSSPCPPESAAADTANAQTILPAEQTPEPVPPLMPEPQRQSGTADEERIAQTLQAGGPIP